jgi:transcription antitermination protein NusB
MGARSKARKRALDILFESELRGLPAAETLADRSEAAQTALNSYTVTLVEGVDEHRAEIDETISAYSSGWSLQRMPAVDRNIVRIAVFELRHVDDVPEAVTLSEAVSLARELSTDESPAFVNGLLAKIAGVTTADHQAH